MSVFCSVAESSRLSDSVHRLSAFRCDTTIDVDQVRALTGRVSISGFCLSTFNFKKLVMNVTVCLENLEKFGNGNNLREKSGPSVFPSH